MAMMMMMLAYGPRPWTPVCPVRIPSGTRSTGPPMTWMSSAGSSDRTGPPGQSPRTCYVAAQSPLMCAH
eukprot:590595-Karenia_brevis.AAC.1